MRDAKLYIKVHTKAKVLRAQSEALYKRSASLMDMCDVPRIVSSQDLQFRVLSALPGRCLDARRTFLFASSAAVPACLHLTRGGPALCFGLLEGSCGRRKRKSMRNQPNVGKDVHARFRV